MLVIGKFIEPVQMQLQMRMQVIKFMRLSLEAVARIEKCKQTGLSLLQDGSGISSTNSG